MFITKYWSIKEIEKNVLIKLKTISSPCELDFVQSKFADKDRPDLKCANCPVEHKGTVGIRLNHLLAATLTLFQPGSDYAHHLAMPQSFFNPFRRAWLEGPPISEQRDPETRLKYIQGIGIFQAEELIIYQIPIRLISQDTYSFSQ